LANTPTNPSATVTPEPATPIPSLLPLPQYTLTTTLDYAAHHLVTEEQIVYTNRTGEKLNELVLMIPPLDFPGVFRLQQMEWEGGVPVEGSNLQGSRMDLPLQTPLEKGESVGLHILYELQLPSPTPSAEVRPIPFGYTARQTNLVDWYPFVAPYIPGKGWLAHKPGYFGEYLVYEDSDFHVNIHLKGDPPDLTVAASSLETKDGEWRRFNHPSARNFAWSVSHQYQIAETSVGNTKVLSYYFPYHQSAGEAALKTTTEALALYNERFGDYRHPALSVVEADFLDGMEYDGLYFLSNGFYNLYQGTPGEYLVTIAAHETAHQWFYGAVGNDQALEPWLDEALCTYAERLYYENVHPEALDWWWTYRVQYYQPSGWVDGSIYNSQGYRAYRDAVYLNGAMFLEELRKLMGDSAFFALLRSYTTEKSGQIATGEDFFTRVRQYTQSDTNSLLKKYFSSP
jgi:Peptidase family M1 domain